MTDDARDDARDEAPDDQPATPRRARWKGWAAVAALGVAVWLFVGLTPVVDAGALHGVVPEGAADGPVTSVWVEVHNGTMVPVTVSEAESPMARNLGVRFRPLTVDAAGALVGEPAAATTTIPKGGSVALEILFPEGCRGLPVTPDGAAHAVRTVELRVVTLGLPRTLTITLPDVYAVHFPDDPSLPCA